VKTFSAPGLTVEGASVAYRNGTVAMRDATFSVPRGSITALVGVNGSGKSTLFKAIMGFVPLAAGRSKFSASPVRRR
jgi:manganese/iron transport system ATP-binding protein